MKKFIQTLFFFLLTTQICFGQWTQVGLNNKAIKDIAVQNQNIFAVTADSCGSWQPMFDQCLGKLYRSTDNGLNWTMLADSNVVDVAISTSGRIFKIEKDSVYGFGKSANLYYSLDNGNNWIWSDIEWQLIDSLLYPEEPERITVSPNGIIYCNIVDGYSDYEQMKSSVNSELTEAMEMAKWRDIIARSTDDGVTWSTPGKSVIGGDQFYLKDSFVFTIGYNFRISMPFNQYFSYIHISSDYGNTWNYLGSSVIWYIIPIHILSYFSNDNIFANAGDILYSSTDTCITWTPIATLNIQSGLCWSIGSSEGMLIGTEDLGVFVFSDEGDSLGSKNEGLTNLNIQTLTLDNNGYVYAGTENGVWRRPISEIITSIGQEPTQPTEFILEQNYPNPFNPNTVISYQLPVSSDVVLKVFDVLGNEIATLVDEYKTAGRYEVEFNARVLPSGVYFNQLKAGEYVQTRKMVLLK